MVRMPSQILIACLLVMGGSLNAFSQGENANGDSFENASITESEAIQKSLEKSRGLRKIQSEVAAQSKISASARYDVKNPELRLRDISTKYFDKDEDNKQFQFGLRWKPPQIGELGTKQRKERVNLWEKKTKAWEARQALIADVREVYATLGMLQSYSGLTQQQAELHRQLFLVVEKLGELGRRSPLDRIKVRRKYLKAKKEAAGTAQRYEETKQQFSALTGEEEGVTVLWSEPEVLPIDEAIIHERAVTAHPAVELARQRSEFFAYRYKAERYKLIPWFTFVDVSYQYESKKKDSGELVLGIELPLFNWNLGELRATEIERKQGKLSSSLAIASIDRKLKERLAEYDKAVAEYRSLKEETDGSLSQSENMVAQAKLQELPEDEILEMEISNIELRMMLLEAGFRVKKAAIELCRTAGVENDRELTRE